MEREPEAGGIDCAEVARSLRDQTGEARTMGRALEMVVELVDGCDQAAISLIRPRGRIETLYAVGDGARAADERQYVVDDGPCLSSIRRQETTEIPDLTRDRRWPQWADYVATELGLHSALCFRLFTRRYDYGALNLYSTRVDAFDDGDRALGFELAAQVAVALATAQQIDTLTRSLTSRGVIGIATGVVMERYDLDQEAGFTFLRRVSGITGTRLYELAQHIASTRQVPLTRGLPIESRSPPLP